MKCNVGSNDAFWRALIGISVGAAGWYFRAWWGLPGVVLVITAIFSFCPLYKLFGISTYKDNSAAGTKQDESKTS
jgi:hypothetical protein